MLKYDQKYICFDTETEGLNLYYSRPWEVSFILAKGTKIIGREQIYVDIPNLFVPDIVKKLTGFNQKKYDAKRIPPKEAWDKVKKYLYNPQYKIIGQNILCFDCWMIAHLAELAGENIDYSIMERFLDTRFLAQAMKHEIAKPRDGNYLSWFYKLCSARLKGRVTQLSLLKEFGIEFDEKKLHDGLYDCEKSFEIFLELKKALKL